MVSNIGDGFRETFPQQWPNVWPHVSPTTEPQQPYIHHISEVSRQEFDALKREMEELKKLLQAAKCFDEATGQPDCEMGDKVELIKRIAKMVGVELGDVFEAPKPKGA